MDDIDRSLSPYFPFDEKKVILTPNPVQTPTSMTLSKEYPAHVRDPVDLTDMMVYDEPDYMKDQENFSNPKPGYVINVYDDTNSQKKKKQEEVLPSPSQTSTVRTHPSEIDNSPKILAGGTSHYHRVQSIK